MPKEMEYTEEINLKELFFILKKRLVLILALTLLAMALAAVVSFFILEPQYQTSTTLMIGKPKDYKGESGIEYNELILNQKLVSTYGELVKTRAVADKVIKDLGLEMSFTQFINKVNVNLVKDTEIIKLTVTDNDPQLATRIANQTAQVFMQTVKEIMLVENVQIIDKAILPKNPIKPKKLMNIAIAGVLGLMLGVFITFIVEFLDNTIKSKEDIEKYLGLPVLGMIPDDKEI